MQAGVLNGQSNYDLTNQLYGTMDCYIKLLIDNNTLSSSSQPTNPIKYETVKNLNTDIAGFHYTTRTPQTTSLPQEGYITEDGGSFYANSSGDIYIPSI
jgi:hypothetical protein